MTPGDVGMSHLAVFAISSIARKQTATGPANTTNLDEGFDIGDIDHDGDGDENISEIIDDDLLSAGDSSIQLDQQPLAVALWISNSTMPSGMPAWFGPLNRNQPTAVRVALHINISSNSESGAESHPLDTSQPATILRYIVENLEQLSWLTSRASTRALQRSALPVHVTAIGRLHRQLFQLTQRVQQFQAQQQQSVQATAV